MRRVLRTLVTWVIAALFIVGLSINADAGGCKYDCNTTTTTEATTSTSTTSTTTTTTTPSTTSSSTTPTTLAETTTTVAETTTAPVVTLPPRAPDPTGGFPTPPEPRIEYPLPPDQSPATTTLDPAVEVLPFTGPVEDAEVWAAAAALLGLGGVAVLSWNKRHD
jgi:hypothetical protein